MLACFGDVGARLKETENISAEGPSRVEVPGWRPGGGGAARRFMDLSVLVLEKWMERAGHDGGR